MSSDTPGSAVSALAAVNQRLMDLAAALALACEASESGWATLEEVAGRFDPPIETMAQWRAQADLQYLADSGVVDMRMRGDLALVYRPRPQGKRR